jgi:two-component system, cell cycle sensor histidine kinase and response regulator CckA
MKRILVVDDHLQNLYYLSRLIEGQGQHVMVAREGREALEMARREAPDLCITDLLMPVMDGFTLLRHWKADEELRRIPVMVYTATYTDPQDEKLAMDLGADAFILKPAEPEVIVEKMEELFRLEEAGRSSVSQPHLTDEPVVLRHYSEALVRRLEEKTKLLELANQDLRARETWLRAILDTSPECIHVLDAEGRLREINQSGWRMLGWENAAQVLGKRFAEWVVPEDQATFEEFATRVFGGAAAELQFRLRSAAGDLRWLEAHAAPLRGETEEVEAFLGIGRDITARKQAEERIATSEAYFRNLIENASDLITVLGSDGRIVFQGPSMKRLMGHDPDGMIGHMATEWVHPEDLDRVTEAIRAVVARRDVPVRVEYRYRDAAGAWRTLESIGRSLADRAGNILVVANSRDVTESRQMQEQLRQSQKMEAIGQLAGGVAHDFNNILAAMMMQCEFLGMEAGLPESVREGLRSIRASGERAADLTRQLLLFSRKQVLELRNLELNAQVSGMARMLRRIIGEDVKLDLRLHAAPLPVRADAGMLDQVMLNLVVNARDAMPQGGTLRIQTRERVVDEAAARHVAEAQAGTYVCLEVEDGGCGIEPEILPHIFEPFYTTKEAGKGTGLGLATVFGIVKQHGGWIQVTSEPGKGTLIQIHLPAGEAGAVETPKPATRTEPRGGVETILLVEDDSAVRRVIRIALTRNGYQVEEAASGAEAIERWSSAPQRIALLLTDMVMPDGMSGQVLADRLLAERPGLKIIYMSGYSAEFAGRELQLRQGEFFLQKPFATELLLETLRTCLDA